MRQGPPGVVRRRCRAADVVPGLWEGAERVGVHPGTDAEEVVQDEVEERPAEGVAAVVAVQADEDARLEGRDEDDEGAVPVGGARVSQDWVT